MPEGLVVFLENVLAFVGMAADYLLRQQGVLNLVLILLTFCLAILAIAAYARAREATATAARALERRPFAAPRAGDSKPVDAEPGERAPPAMAPSVPPLTTPPGPTDTGHRLSRLEESFLQLNRDMTKLEDLTKDLRQEIELLTVRLREPETAEPTEVAVESVDTVTELAASRAVIGKPAKAPPDSIELVRPGGELVRIPDAVAGAMEQVRELDRRVDDLEGALESQRRTVLAIGQVVAQMPDWRKFRASIVESLERIASAAQSSQRQP